MDQNGSGAKVVVIDASGKRLARRAVSEVEVEGHDFPIIWVCREEEWLAAAEEGREPDAVPWPAEDVDPAEESVGA